MARKSRTYDMSRVFLLRHDCERGHVQCFHPPLDSREAPNTGLAPSLTARPLPRFSFAKFNLQCPCTSMWKFWLVMRDSPAKTTQILNSVPVHLHFATYSQLKKCVFCESEGTKINHCGYSERTSYMNHETREMSTESHEKDQGLERLVVNTQTSKRESLQVLRKG